MTSPAEMQAAAGAPFMDWQPDRIRTIIDNLKEVVFQTDAEGRWTFLNPAWREITGFTVEESLGVVFLDYVHPEDRELNRQRFQPLIERKKDYCRHEIRYLTKDGGFRWIEVHARLTLDHAGRIIGTSGTLSDVTGRRQAMEESREARQRLEFVLASNPAVVFAARPGEDGVPWATTFMSDNSRSILGSPPEAYTGDPGFWLAAIHPDDLTEVHRSFADLAAHGESSLRCRHRFADGSYRWMRIDVRMFTDLAGQPLEVFGCVVDETLARNTADLERLNQRLRSEIAERRAAQQALVDREAHFRTLIENASDLIFVLSAAGVIEYVSPTVTRVLGYAPRELVGRNGVEFLDPHDAPAVTAAFQQGLTRAGSHSPLEFGARHRDGSSRVVEAIGSNQLDNPAVRGIVVNVRDITDRRRLEDQFRQAQKMEAVGRLAGGVAHDFNNLLTVICGYSELLAKGLGEADPLRRKVTQVQRAGERATALVQQLLAFSRKQVVEPAVVDLNEAVADMEKMLRRLIGEDVELTIVPWPEPLYVHIDRTQFDQIVMNLSVNARDAMPRGGVLSISTRHHTARGLPACRDCKIAAGDFAVLVVEDTGTGITEETRAHMFEPFFTTKDVGQGTGLGLSMVYGAVQQAGGHICLDTELGKGTAFRICLPKVRQPAPVQQEGAPAATRGGRETILLVEDEELVRTMLSDALAEAGYRVLEARHGEHALEVAGQYAAAIDLLLTDAVMPRMSGRELAAHLAPLRPNAKVLYISGYPRQELNPGCRFLKKPFTPDELIREVRAVFDEVS